jgi:hypothetical protein
VGGIAKVDVSGGVGQDATARITGPADDVGYLR